MRFTKCTKEADNETTPHRNPYRLHGRRAVHRDTMILSLLLAATFYTAPLQPCEWCGCTNSVERHHIIPQSSAKALAIPELLTDERNLVFLCDDNQCGNRCHLLIGHLGNYALQNTQLAQMIRLRKRFKDVKTMPLPSDLVPVIVPAEPINNL